MRSFNSDPGGTINVLETLKQAELTRQRRIESLELERIEMEKQAALRSEINLLRFLSNQIDTFDLEVELIRSKLRLSDERNQSNNTFKQKMVGYLREHLKRVTDDNERKQVQAELARIDPEGIDHFEIANIQKKRDSSQRELQEKTQELALKYDKSVSELESMITS